MEQDFNQSNTFRSLPLGRAGGESTGGESTLSLIAAVAANGAIGFENKLLYWLPNDLKRFKALTTGHTIVMGRRTFESLPKGALPNRRNIVLSRNADFIAENIEVFPSLEAALAACAPHEEVFVIGGASVYQVALSLADRLYLTYVHDTPAQADVFFPVLSLSDWCVVSEERHEADERHAFPYTFVDFKRKH